MRSQGTRGDWRRVTVTALIVAVLLSSLPPSVGAAERRTRGSHIGPGMVVGDVVYFVAYETPRGATLWRSDGTRRGTRMVRDIRPLDGPRDIFRAWYPFSLLTSVDGTLLFVVDDAVHGAEPWRSDGTRRGTRLVRDIRPGRHGAPATVLAVLPDRAILLADDGVHGRELWITDKTARGARPLREVRPGRRGIDPVDMIVSDGRFFFAADDGTHAMELWSSDGTSAGTRLVSDIRPGARGSKLEDFATVDGKLLFFADDGVHGHELWVSDGTEAGTVLLKDLTPDDTARYLHSLCAIAEDADRVIVTTSYDIWVSDGTADGTAWLTSQAQNASGSIDLEYCEPAGDGRGVYLTGGHDGSGYGLWYTDGTELGTVEVASFDPKSGEAPEIQGAPDLDGRLVFAADDGDHGWEPWVSDGTPLGTAMIRDIHPDGSGALPWSFGGGFIERAGDLIYLAADDGLHGQELWVTDGTPEGTRLVRDIHPQGDSHPTPVATLGSVLLFTAEDGMHGRELWRSDGTSDGTRLIRDINTHPQG